VQVLNGQELMDTSPADDGLIRFVVQRPFDACRFCWLTTDRSP